MGVWNTNIITKGYGTLEPRYYIHPRLGDIWNIILIAQVGLKAVSNLYISWMLAVTIIPSFISLFLNDMFN